MDVVAPVMLNVSAGPAFESCLPLLIEDDQLYATLVAEAFKKNGVPGPNIRVATDGDSAIMLLSALAARGPGPGLPSVIILDLFLKKRSGLAVLSWMRAQPTLADIPVVVLTGTRRAADEAEALKLGVLSLFEKPLEFSELVRMVRQVLATCEAIPPKTVPYRKDSDPL
jgi:DNA-binding response OmpR family regulator